jgi:hypothetical protein
MGITIHYETMFKGGKTDLMNKLNELSDFARVLGFAEVGPIYEVSYKTDFNTPDRFTPMVENPETGTMEIDGSYRWAKIQAEPRPPLLWINDDHRTQEKKRKQAKRLAEKLPRMNGFILSLWWGEGCEATNLCFVRTGKGMVWTGSSFTKTQYASDFVKAHVAVCMLLKGAMKMELVTSVDDEGDYFESEDITKLTDANHEMLKMLAAFSGLMQEKFGAENVQGGGLKAEEKLKEFPNMEG